MAVQVVIPVADVDRLLGLGYTKIEVWQSNDEGGTYEEVTASVARAAKLTSSPANTYFRVGGRQLKIRINGQAEQVVAFAALIEWWTPTQVANRINEVVAGLASVVGNTVVLTSPTTGRASTLEVTYNDASELGWAAGDKARGLAVRFTLVSGVLSYLFDDVGGTADSRYKWRYSANGAEPISEYSDWTHGTTAPLASLPMSVATALFVGIDGRPSRRKVVIGSDEITQSGIYFIGEMETREYLADENGLLQISLVQGAKIVVAIEGTDIVRRITVPATATFNLLTTINSAPDQFTVQVPSPLLTRRSP